MERHPNRIGGAVDPRGDRQFICKERDERFHAAPERATLFRLGNIRIEGKETYCKPSSLASNRARRVHAARYCVCKIPCSRA